MYIFIITEKAFAQKEQIEQASTDIDQRIQEFESIFGDKEGKSHISVCWLTGVSCSVHVIYFVLRFSMFVVLYLHTLKLVIEAI